MRGMKQEGERQERTIEEHCLGMSRVKSVLFVSKMVLSYSKGAVTAIQSLVLCKICLE